MSPVIIFGDILVAIGHDEAIVSWLLVSLILTANPNFSSGLSVEIIFVLAVSSQLGEPVLLL